MGLIDVDAFRREFGFAKECRDCKRNAKWECAAQMYSARDICGWLDDTPIVTDWVSVEDRLPEKNVPVLVWEKQGFAYVDRLEAECAWQIASTHHAIVTHWRPLPEPPEEVSGDD